jgi:signal transduction histidine kinase
VTPPFYSLKWRLIKRLVALQAIMLLTFGAGFVVVFWSAGFAGITAPGEDAIEAVRSSLSWEAGGTMSLHESAALTYQQKIEPDFWFLVYDSYGNTIGRGPVPSQLPSIAASFAGVAEARFDGSVADPLSHAVRMKLVESSHGPLRIFVGHRGALTPGKLLVILVAIASGAVLPGIVLTGLVTLAVTPLVVRGLHRDLIDVTLAAQRIDIDKRGYRLPLHSMPAEIAPLVTAMNETLARLDDGHDRQKRFMLAAAHELRTPIAILQTRLEAMPATIDNVRLLEDVARLSTLANQLLDLQRLSQDTSAMRRFDLAGVARNAVVALAPLAIAAGYRIDFNMDSVPSAIRGDATSIERAIANLVQNAIEHAGRRGVITVAVQAPALVSVIDDGPGIPPADRERIFEPFQRLSATGRGIGLGLNLVKEIAILHGAKMHVEDVQGRGTCFSISFPADQCS